MPNILVRLRQKKKPKHQGRTVKEVVGQKIYKHEYRFGGNREIAIQRDRERCVKCGITRIQHYEKFGFDIHVDHIDGRGAGVKSVKLKNNSLDNLQTLCVTCHAIKDKKRKLKTEDVVFIRKFRKTISGSDLARMFDVSHENITQICQRKIWKHVA